MPLNDAQSVSAAGLLVSLQANDAAIDLFAKVASAAATWLGLVGPI